MVLLLILLLIPAGLQAQDKITSPKQQFGFDIGDDYVLVNYTQYVDYLKKLDRESERLTVEEIGKSSEGRSMYLAIVTSPENQKSLAHYKDISQRLSRAEGLNDDQARVLAAEGKAVVWIDGGLHANEVLGAQQLIENVYELVSRTDPETMRFLKDVIILNCLVNPDGMELVSNWYMSEPEPAKRSIENVPRLYNKYAGHDNNRDFYMAALQETDAINKVLYRDWFPQIVYDHHQSGPAGAVMFAPPFRDPFNFFFDPMIITLLDEVGAAMQSRFVMEGKPGVTSRSGAAYSTWWNGALRTSPYFHNQIGLLTETIGNPTPIDIPFVPEKALAKNELPFPIDPQSKWHFRQSIAYSITANRAVLDYGSRNKDRLLFDVYRMGMNSIDRGNRDTWTNTPSRIQTVRAQVAKDLPGAAQATVPLKYYDALRDPMLRDPRAYIVPSDQPDFLTATKFINALIKNGITIHRAVSPFSVNGKSYAAGSYVVRTAQAFRPNLLDMFEPQDYPDDFTYPGAPPTPPYDIAGWTLAYQMGVKYDRVLDAFDGPFEKLVAEVNPPAGKITRIADPVGYLLRPEANDSFVAVNRLLKDNEEVYSIKSPFNANGKAYPAGTRFIPAKPATLDALQGMAREIGLTFDAVAARPDGATMRLRARRIGLWDRVEGSVPSGWTRLVLEKFEFPFTVVYPSDLADADLSRKFDVLIFVDDSAATPVSALQRFVQDGGTVLAIGRSTRLGFRLGLPIVNALSDLPSAKFYVPGSIVQAKVDNTDPLTFGMSERADLFFDSSPSFRLKPDAARKGVKALVWYDSRKPLRSGWAWGQEHLEGSAAVIDATIGKGKLFLFGPEILFRSQSHGTYKLLFNGIYY